MLEAQQAALSQPNWNNTSADETSTERGSFSAQEHDDVGLRLVALHPFLLGTKLYRV